MNSYKVLCWIEFLNMILKLNCKLIMFDDLNCWIEGKFATITRFFWPNLKQTKYKIVNFFHNMLIRRFYLLVEDSINEVIMSKLSKCSSSPTSNIKLFWFLEQFLVSNKIVAQDWVECSRAPTWQLWRLNRIFEEILIIKSKRINFVLDLIESIVHV
jgi:hypothetical protein